MKVKQNTWLVIGICVVLSATGVGMLMTDSAKSPFDALGGTAYAQTNANNSEGAKNASPPVDQQRQGVDSTQEQSDTQKLLDLKQRERELDRREAVLEQKRLMLETIEADLNKEIADFEVRKAELVEYTKKADVKRRKLIAQLVLSMQSTQPIKSAEILTGLEVGLAVEILSQMTDKKAGKIIDAMESATMIKIIEKMNRVPGSATTDK